MKLVMPTYGYEFLIESNGIHAVNKNLVTTADKSLYQSMLKLLNVDFANAPIQFQNADITQQTIDYVIKANKSLKLLLIGNLNIKQNTEVLQFDETAIFPADQQK